MTPATILFDQLPTVHKSGQNSPKHSPENLSTTSNKLSQIFDEKLMVAAISLSSDRSVGYHEPSINEIILNTEIARNEFTDTNNTLEDGRYFLFRYFLKILSTLYFLFFQTMRSQ